MAITLQDKSNFLDKIYGIYGFNDLLRYHLLNHIQRLSQNRDQFSNTTYSILYNLIDTKRVAVYFTPSMRISTFMEMDVPVGVVGGYNFNNRRIECFVKWSFGIDAINEIVDSQMPLVCNKLFAIIMSEALLIYDYKSNGALSSHESIKKWYKTYFNGIIGDSLRSSASLAESLSDIISNKYGNIIFNNIEKTTIEGRSPAVKITRRGENADLNIDGIPSIEKGDKVLRDSFGDILDDEFKKVNQITNLISYDELKEFADEFGAFGEFIYKNRDLKLHPDNLRDSPEDEDEGGILASTRSYRSSYNNTLQSLKNEAHERDRQERLDRINKKRIETYTAEFADDYEEEVKRSGSLGYQLGLGGRAPVVNPKLKSGSILSADKQLAEYISTKPKTSFITTYLIDDDFRHRGLSRASIQDLETAVEATKKAKAFYDKAVVICQNHDTNDKISAEVRNTFGMPPLKPDEKETLSYGDIYKIWVSNYADQYYKPTAALFALAAEESTANGSDAIRTDFPIDPNARTKADLVKGISMTDHEAKLQRMSDYIRRQKEIDASTSLNPAFNDANKTKLAKMEADMLATFTRYYDEGRYDRNTRTYDKAAQDDLNKKRDEIIKFIEDTTSYGNIPTRVLNYNNVFNAINTANGGTPIIDRKLLTGFGSTQDYNDTIKDIIYVPTNTPNAGAATPHIPTSITDVDKFLSGALRVSKLSNYTTTINDNDSRYDQAKIQNAKNASAALMDKLKEYGINDISSVNDINDLRSRLTRAYISKNNNPNYITTNLYKNELLPLLSDAYKANMELGADNIDKTVQAISTARQNGVTLDQNELNLLTTYLGRTNKFNPSKFLNDMPEEFNKSLTKEQLDLIRKYISNQPRYLDRFKSANMANISRDDFLTLMRIFNKLYDLEGNFLKPNLLNCTTNKIKLNGSGAYEKIKFVTGAIGMLRIVLPSWEEMKDLAHESFVDMPKRVMSAIRHTYRVGKLLLPLESNMAPYINKKFGFGKFADKDYFDIAYDINFKIKKMYSNGKGTTRRGFLYSELYMPVTIFQKVLFMQLSSIGDYNPEILFLINCANKGLESLL